MISFSKPNPMRTLGQSQRGSTIYPRVRGHCVGAFSERSSDIHVLLRETVKSAAKHNWRKVGATSPETAFATYMAICHSRWGAEIALQGARLRLSRAYLTFSAQSRPTDRAYENTSTEFDPSRRRTAHGMRLRHQLPYILGGPPEGQDTDRYLLLRRTSTSLARRTFDSVMYYTLMLYPLPWCVFSLHAFNINPSLLSILKYVFIDIDIPIYYISHVDVHIVYYYIIYHYDPKAKSAIYESLILSNCLYGCESWCLPKSCTPSFANFTLDV